MRKRRRLSSRSSRAPWRSRFDGLGGQDHPWPQAVEGLPDLCFAVHIHMGGIVKRHAPVQGPAQHPHGLVKREANNGDGAESHFGDLQPGFPQDSIAHGNSW